MNQVYVCSSYFHVFVSILKIIDQKQTGSRSLIIINNHIPDMANLIPRLKEAGYFDSYLLVPFYTAKIQIKKKYSRLSNIFRRNKNIVEMIDSSSEISTYDDFIRHAEINIFNNQGFAYVYFLLKYKDAYIRLVEDGMGNYYQLIGTLKAFRRRYILNTVVGAGYDPEVKEIQVKFPEKVSEKLRHKAKQLDLKKFQENLSNEDREKVLRVFMNDVKVSLTGDRKLLLITQPLSEDKFFDEDKKIRLYNTILEPYGKDFTIFLKPHPREITDYKKKLNYNFIEIPRGFPLEMFNLLEGLHFEVALTVFSSAINNVICIDKKVMLGKEYAEVFS